MATGKIENPIVLYKDSIETGSSGNWTWSKYPDGRCELDYNDTSYSATIDSLKGNVYAQASAPRITLPLTLVAGADASISYYVDSSTYITWAAQVTVYTQTVTFRLVCVASMPATTGRLHIHISGKTA